MVYIDLLKVDKDLLKGYEEKYKPLLQKIIIYFRKKTNYISFKRTNFGEMILIQDMKSKTIKKLENILKINSVKKACLSILLMNNNKILEMINQNQISIIEGKELKKYLLYEFIVFIVNNKQESLERQEVSFLASRNTSLISHNIEKIAKDVRSVNIITEKPEQFKTLENKLYENNGIILNITNNYKKSLLNSTIIFNYDFSEEEINKYTFKKDCSILNLAEGSVGINKKGFIGLNIKDIKFKVVKNKIRDKQFKNFGREVLYESVVLKNSNIDNIFKRIKEDNIKIVELYGQKGIIRKKEIIKNA